MRFSVLDGVGLGLPFFRSTYPLPRCLRSHHDRASSHFFSDALRHWVSRKLAKTGNRKYRPSEKQKPDAIVAGANKRLASRFYQLKTSHCLTGQYFQWTTRRPNTKCWWCQDSIQTVNIFSRTAPSGVWCQQKTLWAAVLEETRKPQAPLGGGTAPNCGAARR